MNPFSLISNSDALLSTDAVGKAAKPGRNTKPSPYCTLALASFTQ